METNYDIAKRLLRNVTRKDAILKYYNTYKNSRTLKVFFFTWDDAELTREFTALRAELAKLADSSDEDHRGGLILRFAK